MSGFDKIVAALTDTIVKALETGTVPWQKPWGGDDRALRSTGAAYRGYNQMILSFIRSVKGYASPVWMTWNQIEALGGKVKDTEKKNAMNVVFYKFQEKKETVNGREVKKKIPFMRYYRVYNLSQTEGVKLPARLERATVVKQHEFTPIEACKRIIDGYKGAPTIVYGEQKAYYRPSTDTINMPKPESFEASEQYYSTLFHEAGHSTGAEKRLDREGITDICPFGSCNYSKEELVAEMAAAFLCGQAGIANKTVDQSASYIQGWLRKLKAEPKLLLQAAAAAQKAAEHILGEAANEAEPEGDEE